MKRSLIILLGLLLIVYGFWLHWGAGEQLALSPGLMPILVGVLILLIGPALELNFKKASLPFLMVGLILLYALAWYLLGARLATLIFIFLGLIFLEGREKLRSLALAFAMLLLVDLVFARIFGIRLP